MNQGQQRQFRTVGGGGENQTWKIQAVEKNGFAYNPQGNNTLQGYFSNEREVTGTGPDAKPFVVVTITTVNPDGSLGESIDVIADTVLKDRLSKINMNSYVCLTYMGRAFKKGYPQDRGWTQTNSYHNWEVGVDDNAIPLNQLTGRTSAPAQNAQQPVQNQPVFNTNQAFQNNVPAFNPQMGSQQNQQVFNTNQQPAAPVFSGGTGQPFQQQPVQTQQAAPVQQGQQWTPPQGTPSQTGQNFQQNPAQYQTGNQGGPGTVGQPVFNQGNAQMANANPNVFGGPQQSVDKDDLPF